MMPNALADSPPIPTQMWVIYAFGALVIVYFFFMRQRQSKDPLSRPGGVPRPSLSRQRDVEKQMESLLVELSEMARQITAQLDTRAAKLEALIKEADEKIAAMYPARRGEPPTPALAGRDVARKSSDDPQPTDDPRHSAVYDLADAGLSAGQIAQRLSRPSGEVELILALRPGK